MNTRLQVEHPVTELVTGIDIVREQITVATRCSAFIPAGACPMDMGTPIECRVYAEDPENNFFPSPGRISRSESRTVQAYAMTAESDQILKCQFTTIR